MPQAPTPPKPRPKRPLRERRMDKGKPGSIGWLKQLVGRPLTLERRGGQLHLALAERRRPPEAIEAEALEYLRSQLLARMGALEHRQAALVMRPLLQVHDMLGRLGWPGVATLSSPLLAKAGVQAQMLNRHAPSSTLTDFIEQLRRLQGAASVREEDLGPATARVADRSVEVTDGSHEEFEAAARNWIDTVPPRGKPPEDKG